MEVWHQKPYSGFYGARAKVFESHDYYLKSVCYSSLIYLCLQVHYTGQSDDEDRLLFSKFLALRQVLSNWRLRDFARR